jgi:hypothetical protein
MNRRALVLVSTIVLLSATVIWAEDSALRQPASLNLSKGKGAWIIQIHRAGGIVGETKDVTISSDGRVQCDPQEARCGIPMSLTELKTWSDLVFNTPSLKSPYFVSGMCTDCYMTAITVHRRNEKGKEEKLFACWDDPASDRLPAEWMRIIQAANSISK